MQISLDHIVPQALRDLYSNESIWGQSLTLDAAHYYLVNAASGKGKSTLISYLYGLRNDYSGTLCINGKDIRSFSLNHWANLRKDSMSIVFQDLRLFGNLTAMENIEIKRQLTGQTGKAEVLHMCETLGITGLLDKKACFLSMGQQQRVAIVRAMAQPFRWLLLDEPFSHLDRDNIVLAESLIDAYCKKNGAGLIVTSLGDFHTLSYHKTLTV